MRAKRLKPLLLPLFACAALAIHAALFFLVFRPYEESHYHWFHGIIYVWLDRPLLFYFGSQILLYLLLAALRPRVQLARLRRAAVLITVFFFALYALAFLSWQTGWMQSFLSPLAYGVVYFPQLFLAAGAFGAVGKYCKRTAGPC